jgi:hypothetical protein
MSAPLVTLSRRRLVAGLVTGPLAVLTARAQSAVAPGDLESPISPVERWLLMAPQLARLPLPSRLVYRFESSGSLAASESFELSLRLQRAKGGGASPLEAIVQLPRNEVPLPLEGNDPANPIVPWFLDRDVATMERLTGGQRRHFQKRIRYALAEAQQLDAVQVDRSGAATLAAQEVRLQPYLKDPLRQKFEKLATKRYRFTLARAVAGQVWQIQTVIPAAAAGAEPLLTETLTFVSAS